MLNSSGDGGDVISAFLTKSTNHLVGRDDARILRYEMARRDRTGEGGEDGEAGDRERARSMGILGARLVRAVLSQGAPQSLRYFEDPLVEGAKWVPRRWSFIRDHTNDSSERDDAPSTRLMTTSLPHDSSDSVFLSVSRGSLMTAHRKFLVMAIVLRVPRVGEIIVKGGGE